MKRILSLTLAGVLLAALAACSPGAENVSGNAFYLELDEYDIYQDGKVVLEIEDVEPQAGIGGVSFVFGEVGPEEHGLDYTRIETKRGLKTGDSLDRFLELYGDQDYVVLPPHDYPNPDGTPLSKEEFLEALEGELDPNGQFSITMTTIVFEGGIVESQEELESYDWYGRVNAPVANYSFNVAMSEGAVGSVLIVHNFGPEDG